MRCSMCGHDSPAGSLFCLNCGSQIAAAPPMGAPMAAPYQAPVPGGGLLATCPTCRAENPPSMKFCRNCGTVLSTSSPGLPPTPVMGGPPMGGSDGPAAGRLRRSTAGAGRDGRWARWASRPGATARRRRACRPEVSAPRRRRMGQPPPGMPPGGDGAAAGHGSNGWSADGPAAGRGILRCWASRRPSSADRRRGMGPPIRADGPGAAGHGADPRCPRGRSRAAGVARRTRRSDSRSARMASAGANARARAVVAGESTRSVARSRPPAPRPPRSAPARSARPRRCRRRWRRRRSRRSSGRDQRPGAPRCSSIAMAPTDSASR